MPTTNISFSDCVRHLYVRKLNTISKCCVYGMRKWLFESEHYAVTDSQNNYVELCYYDEQELLSVWASDVSRLSCAAFESVANVKTSGITNKFLAWNLVQYYYSAFYSAHSILKILGYGLVQLDGMIIDRLSRKAMAAGITISSSINRGMYCIKFESNNKLILYKVNRYDDSHKGLWKRFFEILSVLNGEYVDTNLLNNDCIRIRQSNESIPLSFWGRVEQNDALDVQNRISQLKSIMNLKGDQNWLSYIRNIVNYNHGLGSWYPYFDYSRNYEKVVLFQKSCFENFLDKQFDVINSDDDILKFTKTCQLINAMNYDLLVDLKERNPESKSFIKDPCFKYINLLKRKI